MMRSFLYVIFSLDIHVDRIIMDSYFIIFCLETFYAMYNALEYIISYMLNFNSSLFMLEIHILGSKSKLR
jgi:hypothetical protein